MGIRNLVLRQFSQSIAPPLQGSSTSITCNSQVDMEVTADGGTHWQAASTSGTIGLQIVCRLGSTGGTEYYDTEMVQMSVGGGTMPQMWLLRESPTKASLGRMTQTSNGNGSFTIDSFFDVFTELSTDGGNAWQPVLSGPLPVQLDAPPPLTLTCPQDITTRALYT